MLWRLDGDEVGGFGGFLAAPCLFELDSSPVYSCHRKRCGFFRQPFREVLQDSVWRLAFQHLQFGWHTHKNKSLFFASRPCSASQVEKATTSLSKEVCHPLVWIENLKDEAEQGSNIDIHISPLTHPTHVTYYIPTPHPSCQKGRLHHHHLSRPLEGFFCFCFLITYRYK